MLSRYPDSIVSIGFNHQTATSGSVDILLCTLNGARFLPTQLASFEAQDFTDWRLFVSDDGSDDDTLSVLTEFQKKHGPHKVTIRRGPAKGFVRNFLSLICDPALTGDYYALSDQDDIWASHKLSRARSLLSATPSRTPSVYCSRTRLVDENGIEFGLSPLFRRPPHFRNALVQCIAGGNTMVLNKAIRDILARVGPDIDVPSHDWWIYLATTAAGGIVHYDPSPTVAYRIHAANLIGSNRSFHNRLHRLRMLWKDRFKTWSKLNIQALERLQDAMLDDNRETFELFCKSRDLGLLPRMRRLYRSGVYRQTTIENVGLAIAALLGKI